jgi:hypothetical protein
MREHAVELYSPAIGRAGTVPHDWPSWRAQFAHHLPRLR